MSVSPWSWPGRGWNRPEVPAVALSMALGATAVLRGWRGTDYPAQLFRVDLVRHVGLTAWNNQWYSGHATPGYGILTPVLGAVFGPFLVGFVSCVVASWAFAVLVVRQWGSDARWGAALFGVGTVVNLAVGRLPFALGLAFGLAGLVYATRRRRHLALLLALLCPLASPIAGLFLAVAGLGWAFGRADFTGGFRRFVASLEKFALLIAAVALLPIAVTSIAFPEGGNYPMGPDDALLIVTTCVAVGWLTTSRAVRAAAILYAVGGLAAFVVPNPAGANVVRLAMFVAGPLLACMLWPRRRRVLLVLGPLLIVWQWWPAAAVVATAGRDPSAQVAYFQPLLSYLATVPVNRIEIPFTRAHWETNFVANHVALARGWERQLDHKYDEIFYTPQLSSSAYLAWLTDNAVQYVALPDVALDFSGQSEAALLRAGVPGMREVWQSNHWRVWALTATRHLVEGPATLIGATSNSFDLAFSAPGTAILRVHFSPHWTVRGGGCVRETSTGWTQIETTVIGRVRLEQRLGPIGPFGSEADSACDDDPRSRRVGAERGAA